MWSPRCRAASARPWSASAPIPSRRPSAMRGAAGNARRLPAGCQASWTAPKAISGSAEMFERFTDQARRVVVLAQEEARLLGHGYIGTEHILLGLLAEGEGLAFQALASLGISLDATREQIAEIIGEGAGQPSGHIPFTPRTKKVLELSLREAQRLGDSYIGTEHILLGLAREGEGVGAQVMDRLGAGKDRVFAQVLLTKRAAPEELRPVTIGRQMPIERPMSTRSIV